MAHAVRSRDLYGLSPEALRAALEGLFGQAANRSKNARDAIRSQIADFERRYEMTSSQLLDRLQRDEITETDDVAEWLFLLQYREHLGDGEEAPA